MNVFDPMQSMNALASGAQMGGAIRSQQTSNALAPMVAKGDYKGAMEYAGSRGDLGQVEAMKTQYQGQLDAEQKARQTGILRLGMSLLQTPQAQRDPMRVAQDLAQFGVEVDPSQLGDLSDASIQSVMASVQDEESLMKQYAEMTKPVEYTAQSLSNGQVAAFNKRTGIVGEGQGPEAVEGPMSTMGKLAADLEAGRITPEQYQIEIDRMEKSAPGLDIQFGEGGALSGITYGSSNKGKDAALVRTPDNTAAVSPGEQQARYNKVLATNKTLDVSDEVVAEDLDRAIGMAGAWTTGFVGAKLEDLQGTPAHDLKMLMQSIKANIGFDKLQQMRDNSPTGGALGQVTELELGLLQSVYGALEQSQTKEQFVYNLERLKKTKQKFADLRAEAFAMDYPDIATTGQFRSNANEQISDWNDADEARLRELEARMGAQ